MYWKQFKKVLQYANSAAFIIYHRILLFLISILELNLTTKESERQIRFAVREHGKLYPREWNRKRWYEVERFYGGIDALREFFMAQRVGARISRVRESPAYTNGLPTCSVVMTLRNGKQHLIRARGHESLLLYEEIQRLLDIDSKNAKDAND